MPDGGVTVYVIGRNIAEVAAAVRALGDGRTIPSQMAKRIRRAVPGIRRQIRAHELAVLPHRGGLNEWVARALVRANVRRGPRSAGVKLVQGRNSFGGRSDFARMDQGVIRAPAWGNREAWHTQAVTAHAFTDGAAGGPALAEFRDAVVEAVEDAKREVGL